MDDGAILELPLPTELLSIVSQSFAVSQKGAKESILTFHCLCFDA